MALYGENGIITFLQTKLQEVSGIGVVHDYDRIVAENFELFKSFYTDASGKINGWTITRTGVDEAIADSAYNTRTHNFVIKGFFQHDDKSASEKTFQELIEAVLDKLNSLEVWNDYVFPYPASVNTIDTVMFGNFLVHHVEINFRVEERKFIG